MLSQSQWGLGLKQMNAMNSALLAKASWRMIQRDEGLWAKTFSEINLKDVALIPNTQINEEEKVAYFLFYPMANGMLTS